MRERLRRIFFWELFLIAGIRRRIKTGKWQWYAYEKRYVKGGFTKPKLSTKLKNWWRYGFFGQVAKVNKGEVIMPIKEVNNDNL